MLRFILNEILKVRIIVFNFFLYRIILFLKFSFIYENKSYFFFFLLEYFILLYNLLKVKIIFLIRNYFVKLF